MNDLISPYEIIEMFHKKFDGFDFAQPYLIGEFKEDPRYGHITIGVRTPWYDIEYFVYSKASFGVGISNNKLVEDVIQQAVRHLNAAVAMQISPDGRSAIRLDLGDINKYLEDPEGYVVESDASLIYVDHDNSLGISDEALIKAKDITFLCTCQPCKKKFYELRMKRVRESRGEDIRTKKERERIHGRPTLYVNHDNSWDDQTLVEAVRVIFLCKCTKCKKHYEHIRELRHLN